MEWTDSGVGEQYVDSAERLDCLFHDLRLEVSKDGERKRERKWGGDSGRTAVAVSGLAISPATRTAELPAASTWDFTSAASSSVSEPK